MKDDTFENASSFVAVATLTDYAWGGNSLVVESSGYGKPGRGLLVHITHYMSSDNFMLNIFMPCL